MFEQTFLEQSSAVRRPWPLALSFMAQAVFTGAIMMVPLLHTAQLALRPTPLLLYAPPKPLPPPPAAQPVHSQAIAAQMLRPVFQPVFTAPRRIPTSIVMSPEPFPVPDFPVSAITGVAAALPFGPPVIGLESKPLASANTTAAHTKQQFLRVGGSVQSAKLLAQPKPVYPALAKAARVSGTVRLQAIIGRDGTIRNLQLIGGPPLLVAAALEAVSRWTYQPTLLNGEPVEVFTEIQVNFSLNQ